MPVIRLTTFINAPAQIVFDLSRSITFHATSMAHTGEKAIAGKTSGLINLNETVTWQARHLGKTRFLQVRITAMKPYETFTDEMVSGDFKMMKHEHDFIAQNGSTIMRDKFEFETPYGFIGKMINRFFLTRYMKSLLEKRNRSLKENAEIACQAGSSG